MTPEVRELYEALIHPSKTAYEKLRARLIEEIGYDAFRDRQKQAFEEMWRRIGRPRPWSKRLQPVDGRRWR